MISSDHSRKIPLCQVSNCVVDLLEIYGVGYLVVVEIQYRKNFIRFKNGQKYNNRLPNASPVAGRKNELQFYSE